MASLIKAFCNENGGVVFAVGGGRTPRKIFPRLAKQNLPWHNVTVTLTDERCVSSNSYFSNENLVRTMLLRDNAQSASFKTLSEESALKSRPDIVYLGFGEDGHIASLFPSGEELGAQHIGVVATRATTAPFDRLSLTLPTLLSSKHIFLIVSGVKKNEVYRDARDIPSMAELPLSRILCQSLTPVTVYVHSQ
ncbi:MAG: 6-phosphogluconolactonase [Magnetovibrio sp.]|nr:6-phosphogluconolactonase [Magnetovibrio sp.]